VENTKLFAMSAVVVPRYPTSTGDPIVRVPSSFTEYGRLPLQVDELKLTVEVSSAQ
jgi:hypothetical protein